MKLPRTPALTLRRPHLLYARSLSRSYKERAQVRVELGFAYRWLMRRRSGRFTYNSMLSRYAHRRIAAFVASRPEYIAWDFSKLPLRRYVPLLPYQVQRP